MPKFFKNFILSFLVALTLLFSVATSFVANAQETQPPTPTSSAPTWYDQSPIEWFNKVYDPVILMKFLVKDTLQPRYSGLFIAF